MDLTPFILAYFASKKICFLRAFICWSPDKIAELWRGCNESNIRLSIHTDFQRLPELPAYDLHREGIMLDVDCPNAALALDKASYSRAFIHRFSWLLLHNSNFNSSHVEDVLSSTIILPDADVIWSSTDVMADVYRVKASEPIKIILFSVDRKSSQESLEQLWGNLPTAAARRKNLDNVYLDAAVIVSQPQHFKGWSDLTDRQIDTFPKFTYPLMLLCGEDLNFRYNLKQIDSYGVVTNGSFDGLVGRLQRREVEIGVASVFLRGDRWSVMHYSAETVELKGAFIFRQPSQSAVTNVFLLPFSRGVWLACAGVIIISAVILAALSWRMLVAEPELASLTPSEAFTFAIGTLCQQGTFLNPSLMSIRVVMFFTLITSLFAFTAYSAKIVAILQSPSDAIQTVSDLTHSPMAMGVQETTYKKIYFAESKDPATQQLFRRKLMPLGEAAYMSVVEGIARMRTGLFAFQVEESSAYDVISRTFTEREKCGLKQIQAFKLPMVAVPILKHSGYRELIATRLRWQREVGLMGRYRRIWMSVRPRCEESSGGFVSVGLRDVVPALRVLAAGAAAALLLLAIERAAARRTATYKVQNRKKQEAMEEE